MKLLIKISNTLRKCKIDLRKSLFKSVISAFGGNLDLIICGGAPLNSELVTAFDSLGITLLGDRNIIGARVTEARLAQGMKQVELLAKLQLAGVDMSVPALSLLEGQKRPVSDIELNALADILNVSVDWLLGRK